MGEGIIIAVVVIIGLTALQVLSEPELEIEKEIIEEVNNTEEKEMETEPINNQIEQQVIPTCAETCIDAGYGDGRGPFDTSDSCDFPEIPKGHQEGVCCCIHKEFM